MGKHMPNFIKPVIMAAITALFPVIQAGHAYPGSSPDLSGCAMIEDDADRLKCYDALAGRNQEKPETSAASSSGTPEQQVQKQSYLTKLWQLNPETRRGSFALMPHRDNYILPFTYNSTPNPEPFQAGVSGRDTQETEVKYQISLKVKLLEDIFDQNMDLWFGYTQQSFWQLYNFEESAPFRETNYEPELLLNFRTNYRLLGMDGRMITVGFNHQSNGRSEPYSRSWNRIVGNFGFERDNFTLFLKTWYRLPENEEADDNPDLEEFMGYGEIWGYYFWKQHRFGVMLRNNLRTDNNRGALQLEWSFPLVENVSGHIQFFTGYGENLLDYNQSASRISVGFILKDWD
jgi:phospholipase A1